MQRGLQDEDGFDATMLAQIESPSEHLLDGFRLTVARPPLCPELWLLAPEVDLERDHREFPGGARPYWAFCWASGQSLARFLLDRPAIVRGRRVLDVGAGSGVAAIAAARAGGAEVGACDLDARSRAACRRNAAGRSHQPFAASPPLASFAARTVPEIDEKTPGAAIYALHADDAECRDPSPRPARAPS